MVFGWVWVPRVVLYRKHRICMHMHAAFFLCVVGGEEFYFRIKFLATEILHMANIWAIVLYVFNPYNTYYHECECDWSICMKKCKQNMTIGWLCAFLSLSNAMTAIADFHVCWIYLANKRHNSILWVAIFVVVVCRFKLPADNTV